MTVSGVVAPDVGALLAVGCERPVRKLVTSSAASVRFDSGANPLADGEPAQSGRVEECRGLGDP